MAASARRTFVWLMVMVWLIGVKRLAIAISKVVAEL